MPQSASLRVLVAPLDWGLGHSTRCIPIIKHLIRCNCTVLIAADGPSESLLFKEFPDLFFLPITGYRITYAKSKRFLPVKILCQLPKLVFRVFSEHRWLLKTVKKHSLDAVISDNRFGLWHPNIPSVFITHQLSIKGHHKWLERVLLTLNYQHINRFSECWVPDNRTGPFLAGELSHPAKMSKVPVHYIGPLSRLERLHDSKVILYDILILLSGPEPQRSLLEIKLLKGLQQFTGSVLLVRGLPASSNNLVSTGNIKCSNHLNAEELETALAQSNLVISRAGYTTIMDIIKLKKNSVLIPTPGQTEQEYLAQHLAKQNICITYSQDDFEVRKAVEQAAAFDFNIPNYEMEQYEAVVDGFLKRVRGSAPNK